MKLLKCGAKDSNIIKDVKLGHKKCSAIVRNIIAKVKTEELAEILRDTPFSILIDESTDISDKKKCLHSSKVSMLKKNDVFGLF